MGAFQMNDLFVISSIDNRKADFWKLFNYLAELYNKGINFMGASIKTCRAKSRMKESIVFLMK
jgi:hypothetical protein